MQEKLKTVALWVIALSLVGHVITYSMANRYTYHGTGGLRTDNWTGEIQRIDMEHGWQATANGK